MWRLITSLQREGNAHLLACSSCIVHRCLAFLNEWGDSTFLGCVERRMLYFFHNYYLTAIVLHLNQIQKFKKRKSKCLWNRSWWERKPCNWQISICHSHKTYNLWILVPQNSSLEGMSKVFQWNCSGFRGSYRLECFWQCFLSWCCLGACYSLLGFQTTLSSFVF